jgi:hypothetical protein
MVSVRYKLRSAAPRIISENFGTTSLGIVWSKPLGFLVTLPAVGLGRRSGQSR